MINNRQNGRRRGRGGGGGGGQRNQGGGQGQRDSGNRIDSRARGNAAQLLEKYKNMARDAQMSGDRVNTEYYLQFADHYFRVLADQRGRYEEQNQHRRGRDDFDGDDDFGDDNETMRTEEPYRADQYRSDEGRQERDERRGNRDRDENGGRRYERDRSFDRERQPAQPAEAGEREMAIANDVEAVQEASEPRRRTRTRRPAVEIESEGEPAFDADRLPPSLGVIASEGEPIEEAKPRRRRRTGGAEASAG